MGIDIHELRPLSILDLEPDSLSTHNSHPRPDIPGPSVPRPWSSYSGVREAYGLEALGMGNLGCVHRNLSPAQLIEHAVVRGEAVLAHNGALCVRTGAYTGRSPRDKFIVNEPDSQTSIDWNPVNVAISEENFQRLYHRILSYIQGRDLYIFDGYVGSDRQYQMGVRVVTELASQSLFAHQLFLRPTAAELAHHQADFTVISVPGLKADPRLDQGVNSEAFIVLHLGQRLVLIGGSRYAGEIKKSVFSLMNYFMARRGVLPMHCAANRDAEGRTALFFGLSGTGKTTLSADPARSLIGDDEHGWSGSGIFNFEGGCYAKAIRLSEATEPQIWQAIRFGALLENVPLGRDRTPDYQDASLTENTRAAYPLSHIPNSASPSVGEHPSTILFLTADAFGVLPPIAKLTYEQALYHFLSGYTSKLAGTERGVLEPQATFSACFGQPFLPLPATVYAEMLGDRLRSHPSAEVYLVNTGWSGGPYGVGDRLPLAVTRALVSAALRGDLRAVPTDLDPVFQVAIPRSVPGISSRLLHPRDTWADPQAYDRQARQLAQRFIDNFQQVGGDRPDLVAAGPRVESP
ncbi:phosphoenolpyruvate carboxykinase (ATP) [Geitlerinema sp. PCC 7407]|uniref:phosphoenolpyruvate carboxykinase (ATP) n=1 Tax=Geitlerinema sp. PCC 7407 TaxID=1173025 RepID=UPI00029F9FBF|nr:phosphoenolpyruvate carboxykinase (ATP) [Geitlerinema sp. PCC 7407]AFY65475.1 phosphoenolpyruvate carboxykinase (ATP) [Geitlerinema sp. PCC 7407]